MSRNQLRPQRDIKLDSYEHFYIVSINNLILPAMYIAWLHPFGLEGPTLLCSYGLLNGPVHTYSSLSEANQ